MRISDWSSDVCSSDLHDHGRILHRAGEAGEIVDRGRGIAAGDRIEVRRRERDDDIAVGRRSEEHTSELQSLMRSSYAVFCLKKKSERQSEDTIYYSLL